MERIRAMLVDDENHCNQTLAYELMRHCPQVEVVAMAMSGEEAIHQIRTLQPDLVFLDIEMPGLSGFELIERLKPISFDVIFVTAYDQYAIQAFRYAAMDYLMKPVVSEQLIEAVARVGSHRLPADQSSQLEVLLHNLRDGLKSPRIALPSGRGMDFVNTEDILYCIAESNYTHIRMQNGSKYTCSKTLKEVEHLLTHLDFFRIHQSYMINMRHLQRYLRDDGGYAVMTDGYKVPIAKRRKEEFLALLKKE